MPRCAHVVLGPLLLAACGGGGGGSNPIGGANVVPELVVCRARVDEPFRFAEITLRDGRNLGTRRVGDRTGVERGVRVHPDGNTLVFARERDNGDPDSTEIFVSTIDGSRAELRLTQDTTADDDPCWSPDGARIVWSSARSGTPRLWVMDRDGGGAAPFRSQPSGGAERQPDWSGAAGRVVWSELDEPTGRSFLNSSDGNGAATGPVTTALATTGRGDESPRFAPDGRSVVFVRRTAVANAALARVDVASGDVQVLLAPGGDVAVPVITPAADRVLFGLAEPAAGRATLRLASLPLAGGAPPVLVWPDERWRLEGLAVLPSLPAQRAADAPRLVDVLQAELQIATATSVFGARAQLASEDGDEFRLTTANIDGREIAGINVRYDLPLAAATDVEELRVRIVLRSSRAGGDSMLRTSLYNPLDERFDTVVERAAATTATVLEYRTSSLRHVTAERQVRITAIAELAPGDRAELFVDLVELVLVPRAP